MSISQDQLGLIRDWTNFWTYKVSKTTHINHLPLKSGLKVNNHLIFEFYMFTWAVMKRDKKWLFSG